MIKSLKDGKWLLSDVIDNYLNLLTKSESHIYYISTPSFLSCLNGSVYNPQHFIGKISKILVPAHINGNHWAMIVVDADEKTITMLDSMNHGIKKDPTKIKILEQTRNIVRVCYNHDDWDIKEDLSVPQQSNANDCGVFALVFASYKIQGRITEMIKPQTDLVLLLTI
uniref:Ubiquitin-like protease family profile domain-containing protein n=1 Tax=Ditylenchus dipsaci TaxID=166011 RepID=A0A915CV39_9BILA